ncbi:MAG: response regulator [Bacteriovoracaceae bacterium]
MTKRKILIIEDDEVTRVKLTRVLEKEGFEVHSLDTPNHCLEIIQKEEIECIVMDNVMPGMSGFDAIKIIRDHIPKNDLPIIVITSKKGPSDIVQALEVGANDFIGKPVDTTITIARINNLLLIMDLNKELIEINKIKTLNSAVATYNHQINNPLLVAYGNLKDRDQISQENINKIKSSLDKITYVVKNIEDLIKTGNIKIKEYIGDTNMLEINDQKKK